MPSWLLWLAPVPLATLGAVAWTAWSGRTRGPAEGTASVAAYERFRSALSTPARQEPPATPAPGASVVLTPPAGPAPRD